MRNKFIFLFFIFLFLPALCFADGIPPSGVKRCTAAEIAAGTSTEECAMSPAGVAATYSGGASAEIQNEAVSSANFDGDLTHGASQDALENYFLLLDTDLDGDIDTIDATLWATKQTVLSEGAFADGDKTKLDGIESSADVTDATNVAAAGARMTSTENAGTDVTADLEEETHATEHEDSGADEIAVTAGMMNSGTNASSSTFWRGDNTWATPAGSGDVSKVGTPAQYQVANWTGDGTLAGITIAGNSVMCTDANGAQEACSNLTDTAIPTASSLSVDDLITLSGVGEGSTHLGTFTGSTITDNQTIKAALQLLETTVEAVSGDITSVGDCSTGACTMDAAMDDEDISPTGGTWDLSSLTSLTMPAHTTGTITVSDEGDFVQTSTSDADYFDVLAYDLDGTTYVSLLRPVASNTPHIEIGPVTNFLKVAQDGTVSLEGTAAWASGEIIRTALAANAVYPVSTTKTAAYTVGTDDAKECYGGTVYVTSAATITACDNLAVGMNFKVVTIGAIAVSMDPQSDDLIYLDGTALDDGDKATNTSTTGDTIYCEYYDATGWFCWSGSPDGDHWTDTGA